MTDFVSLRNRSFYSLLRGLHKPSKLAANLGEAGCLMDLGTVSGMPKFCEAMKEAGKKALVGCEMEIAHHTSTIKVDNKASSSVSVISKNLKGWQQLMLATSASQDPCRNFGSPRLDMEMLAGFASGGDWVGLSGGYNSHLANALFDESGDLDQNWESKAAAVAYKLQDIFGAGNFYVEIQAQNQQVAECLRKIALATNIPVVATTDAYYATAADAEDQRILLCTSLKSDLAGVKRQIEEGKTDLGRFFASDRYRLHSPAEMFEMHTTEELRNTVAIAEMCDNYSIFHKPYLPQFPCPTGYTQDEYLRHLCRQGWKDLVAGKISPADEPTYAARVKYELEVLQGAGLSPYFLLLWDILNFVRESGRLPGVGRGSSAGSIVAYLTQITGVDPIRYKLIFERFYNAGRNTKDKVSMPDIDIDVPAGFRDSVLSYIKNKYGTENVTQIVSFQSIKGRTALKNVFHTYGDMDFNEMNRVTRHIPNDSEISGELEEMKEEYGESSIIRWCLENRADRLKEYCHLESDGSISGPLASRFQQAMRLEGVKSVQSRHPAGIVVTPVPVNQVCPLVLDKDRNLIAAVEMDDLEKLGGLKLDVLGLRLLDKLEGVSQIARYGDVLHG